MKQSGRRRWMNFNKIELDALVEKVNRHSVRQRNTKNNLWNSEKCQYIYIGRTKKAFKKYANQTGGLEDGVRQRWGLTDWAVPQLEQLRDGEGRCAQKEINSIKWHKKQHIPQTAHKKWLWIKSMPYCKPTIHNSNLRCTKLVPIGALLSNMLNKDPKSAAAIRWGLCKSQCVG